jgi:hypothetical protein
LACCAGELPGARSTGARPEEGVSAGPRKKKGEEKKEGRKRKEERKRENRKQKKGKIGKAKEKK